MRVIGTAGHVDHGKSTLIAALTGTHPDRLLEEQARAMTIELGFGWFTLPTGEEIGIVDVPGHRDFIGNMLAGVGGIDAALLVIAADEGVKPQTREHLAILDLLQIRSALVVLTKIDLIPDREWLTLIEAEVREALHGTLLQDAPILRVSARTRVGLDQLQQSLGEMLKDQPARPDLNRPRLPIDRVFSMSGFGTVVTGTLSDGQLALGEEILILPSGLTGRIRGLQTHKRKQETAVPGSRTAVNVSGLTAEQIRRGDVLVLPHQYTATRRLDARFRLLRDASLPLQHGGEVKLFAGTSESIATLRLLDTDEMLPGHEGWIQLELREPLVAVRGDRYILRRPSPGETLGGGVIVDAQPKARHKRLDPAVLKSLDLMAQGTPSDILLEAALALNAASATEVILRSRLEPDQARVALEELIGSGGLIALDQDKDSFNGELLIMAGSHWNELLTKAAHLIGIHHQQFPLRRGMPREEFKSRLKLSSRVFNAALRKMARDGVMVEAGNSVAQAGHAIRFDDGQQLKVQALLRKFAASPHATPSLQDCQAQAGEEVVNALIELNQLVAVSPEVLFRKQDYDEMAGRVCAAIQQKGRISLAETRDLFGTTRKYAQALLEDLDANGITLREGDFRKLRKT